jgi:hypothetical protein
MKIYASQGAAVSQGDKILQLRGEGVNSSGESYTRWATITAPQSGVLTSMKALAGQQFSIGDSVAKIAQPTFLVTGALAPEQLYRLLEQPTEAQVTLNGGPAPFTCTNLTIGAAEATGGNEQTPSGPTMTCSVPAEVRVFAGLTALIEIAGGISEDVLTVPMTAVEGSAETGNVYIVLPDGSSETRKVTLGLNDGINVEIIDGVEEGDQILQFVPGAHNPDELGGECWVDENGNEICGG